MRYFGSTGNGSPIHPEPTGYGLPDYEDGRFSVLAPWRPLETEWCDEAGCPKRKCVHCKETA